MLISWRRNLIHLENEHWLFFAFVPSKVRDLFEFTLSLVFDVQDGPWYAHFGFCFLGFGFEVSRY
jgi:hypothetical protein